MSLNFSLVYHKKDFTYCLRIGKWILLQNYKPNHKRRKKEKASSGWVSSLKETAQHVARELSNGNQAPLQKVMEDLSSLLTIVKKSIDQKKLCLKVDSLRYMLGDENPALLAVTYGKTAPIAYIVKESFCQKFPFLSDYLDNAGISADFDADESYFDVRISIKCKLFRALKLWKSLKKLARKYNL